MSTTTTRTTEPTRIVKGERIAWTKTFCDFGADLYTLEYRFRGAGIGIDVNATADGTDFACEITKTASAGFGAAGKYRWQAWLTEIADTNNTFVAAEGVTEVVAGFDTSSQAAIEMRSTAKQILDAIDAMILNKASSDQMSYEVSTPAGTKKISRMSRIELLALRKEYAGIVERENAAERVRNGGKFGKTVVVNVRES